MRRAATTSRSSAASTSSGVSELSPESPSLAKGLIDVALSLRNVTPRALRALRLLGVTHLMQPTRPSRHSRAGLRLVYDGPDARVYRVSGALPRAFVVGAQRVVWWW